MKRKTAKKLKLLPSIIVLTFLFALVVVPAGLVEAAPPSPPTLTGDASADFAGYPKVYNIFDPQDVGLPPSAPSGTISGWDISRVRMWYDGSNDVLYVGLECFGVICGDADGDGNPGGTSGWLASEGGTDEPNLGGSESIAFFFDTDRDGNFDVVAGVSSFAGDDLSDFDLYLYNPANLAGPHPNPAYFGSFYDVAPGNRLPNSHTLAFPQQPGQPDFEFAIHDFSTLPGIEVVENDPANPTDNTVSFGIDIRTGAAFQDDGIGEQIIVLQTITAIELASFDAQVATDGSVVLHWVTGTEINNAGFNVYRGDVSRNQEIRLNNSLIAPQGSEVAGAEYTFIDRPGVGTFYYVLEDVDSSDGTVTRHGPISVTVKGGHPFFNLFLPSIAR